ncbi:YceD family protein [Kaarinaea lacus]
MSQRLPEFIEPYRLAENQRILTGELSIARMQRLVPMLASNEGEVQVNLVFGLDETGQANVTGEVQTIVTMQCQRCMEPMQVPIKSRVSLAFVNTEKQAQELPSYYEPLIVEEDTSLSDLVEDEIILALPAVPLHETEKCSMRDQYTRGTQRDTNNATETSSTGERPNPFAILETLRKKE